MPRSRRSCTHSSILTFRGTFRTASFQSHVAIHSVYLGLWKSATACFLHAPYIHFTMSKEPSVSVQGEASQPQASTSGSNQQSSAQRPAEGSSTSTAARQDGTSEGQPAAGQNGETGDQAKDDKNETPEELRQELESLRRELAAQLQKKQSLDRQLVCRTHVFPPKYSDWLTKRLLMCTLYARLDRCPTSQRYTLSKRLTSQSTSQPVQTMQPSATSSKAMIRTSRLAQQLQKRRARSNRLPPRGVTAV
jgi:hypothetical protein